MFTKKDITAVNKPKSSSKLSHLMELNKSSPDNPFNEFAKFDGKVCINIRCIFRVPERITQCDSRNHAVFVQGGKNCMYMYKTF